MNDPYRLCIVGDAHGNAEWMAGVIRDAATAGADALVQVGDFGYWDSRSGRAFIDRVVQALSEHGMWCVFVDGNHEDHLALRRERTTGPYGFLQIRPTLFYAPRGARWTWGALRFVALGGARSIDRDWPGSERGVTWFAEETISEDDWHRAARGGPADVVIAHDCPAGLTFTLPWKPGAEEGAHRERLRSLVEAVAARTVVHGHYHVRHSSTVRVNGHDVRVHGMGADHTPPETGWWIVTLDELGA